MLPESGLSDKAPATYSIQSRELVDMKSHVWWLEFGNADLDQLIRQGFTNNLDVAQAIARMNQARAIVTATRSDLFPKINAEGNIGKQWQGSDEQASTGSVGGALSWEVDLFGRISGDTKARAYEAKAAMNDVDAAYLSLSGDIADAYFGAVAAHRQRQLLQQQINTDNELLSIVDLRVENGVGTKVEQLQQQSRVAETESLLPLAEANIRVFENRLDVLLGQAPDRAERTSGKVSLVVVGDIPATGIPLDLLQNRPDLRALRNELIAADADIGAAIADRLPQITLSGSYLYTNTASYEGPLGALIGSFVQPLLDWGEKKAEVERNKALYEERLAAYTQAFLQAVEEVENTLYLENKQRDYIARLKKRERILRDTVAESRARYSEGLDDYTPVLNALQELRSLERDLITEQYQLIQYRIQLHQALGGTFKSDKA